MPDSDKPILPAANKDIYQKLLDLDEKMADLLIQRYQTLEADVYRGLPGILGSFRPHSGNFFLHDYAPS